MLDSIRQNAQSWGVKIAFGLIIIVFVFWGVGSMDNQPSNVVAKVGKTSITVNAFAREYEQQVELVRAQFPDVTSEDLKQAGLKMRVLNQMISEVLLVQQAEKQGLEVSPAELKLRIAGIPVFNDADGNFDGERYKQVLAAQGTTPGAYEDKIRRSMLAQKMRDFITMPAAVTAEEAKAMFLYSAERRSMDYVLFAAENYLDQVKPGEEQISAFYKQNIENYKVPPRVTLQYVMITPAALADGASVSDDRIAAYYEDNKESFRQEERVHARHILVLADAGASEEKVAAAEKKINELYERIRKGADFAKVAKEASEGPSAPLGGDLGWFGRGQMVPEFEQAAFAAAAGQVTAPVRTQFGFHIIKVEEKENARIRTLDEVHDEISHRLAEEAALEKVTPTLDAALEALLAGEDLPAVAERMHLSLRDSGQFTRAQATGLLGVEPASVELIFTTPEGSVIDTPMEVEGGYMLAKVVSSKEETYRELDVVKADVIARLKQQEAMKLAADAAREAVAALKNDGSLPQSAAARVKKSEPFGRQGFIPGVGQAPDVTSAIFKAADDAWIAEAFQTPTGAVVAKRAAVLTPDETQWAQVKDRFVDAMLQSKREELYRAYMQDLLTKTKVELVNNKILE